MAAEELRLRYEGDPDFDHDVNQFCTLVLTPRSADIFRLYVYGGRITQTDIAGAVGVCQATVVNELSRILNQWKEFYYGDHRR